MDAIIRPRRDPVNPPAAPVPGNPYGEPPTMTPHTDTVQTLSPVDQDRRHVLHPFTSIADQQANGTNLVASAEGIRVRGSDGREYIDAMAGLWCANIGYGRPEMAEAIAAQSRKLSYYHSFINWGNEPTAELATRIAAMTPGDLNRVFFANSGSEANDTQVKLIWQYNNLLGRPEKKKFIARKGAYHGVTVASASLSGLPNLHGLFDVPRPGFLHVGKPHHYREAPEGMSEADFTRHLANELEETIAREGAETIAAFFAEPIMGAGGVIVPPAGYFDAIVPILRAHDILLVADEVVCGFGRLGTPFGSTYYGFEPDLMTIAKGLTSGYVPMSGVVVSDRVWQVFADKSPEVGPFGHGYTYSHHPVAAAAGLANLDIIEREGLIENAGTTGAHFQKALRAAVADHPLVGEVRGTGLIAGVELVQDKPTKKSFENGPAVAMRLHKLLLEEGLISRPIVNTMAFSPPLIVTPADMDDIVARFQRGLVRLEEALRAEGAL